MKKRVVSLLLALLLVLGLVPGAAAIETGADWDPDVEVDPGMGVTPIGMPEGEGTEDDPLRIENAEQLAWFAQTISDPEQGAQEVCAALTADIDLEDEPWTLGGQRVSTDVKIRKDGRKRYTYTPDTLHPIVMQLNITQAAYLLKSLGIAYDSHCYGNELSADLAYGIWSQLSPYAKKRIREAYVSEDRVTRYVNRNAAEEKEAKAFGEFLNKMEWKAEHWVDEFFTETEMLNRYDDGIDLMLALKDARYGMEHVYTIQCKDKIFPKCRFYFVSRYQPFEIAVVDEAQYQKLGKENILKERIGERVMLDEILKVRYN